MTGTDLLTTQHASLRELLKRVEQIDEPARRRSLLEQIAHDVEIHTKIEAEIFYPLVRRFATGAAEELIFTSLEEHHLVHVLIAEMILLPEDRFQVKLAVLQELVEHHTEQEEREVFTLAERLGVDELERLGERMRARADQLLRQPHGLAFASARQGSGEVQHRLEG